jgi:geranylgeranyl pyrophosphate synthase
LAESGAWQSFVDVMRLSILPEISEKQSDKDPTGPTWLDLPVLCYRAAGGEEDRADGISAAWGLLYAAAHTMDNVEDDEPSPWWVDHGPAVAINTATGLYASSGLILWSLFDKDIPQEAVIDILGQFQRTILRMCSGQHHELIREELSLEDYWRIAEAKSGSFFALACYAGARLASDDPILLSHLHEFGLHLGILIQIGDDAKEIWSLHAEPNHFISNPLSTLPIIYCLSVLPPEGNFRLRDALRIANENPEAVRELFEIVEKSGAPLYIVTKAEQHRQQAQQALEKTGANPLQYDKLLTVLNQIGFMKKANDEGK